PYFEKITEEEKRDLADILRLTLAKIKKGLNNPDYNFYVRTAPCDNKEHNSFHWHLTILPKTQTWAGFELGAGMEIITTAPEQAAAFLRKVKV
ncbi:MAG: galactose-1-phosphate uridylyltransferase, partial [Patescibacteria group bacterium]